MTNRLIKEQHRLFLQAHLDSVKTQIERNRLGQFATPTSLARDILRFGVGLLPENLPIRFLDPAMGTGSFFSALLHTAPQDRIEIAKGYELDGHYGKPTQLLWQDTSLDLVLGDFTSIVPPANEDDRFNLLICNPPYVRHQHIVNREKIRLQTATMAACGIRIAGLAGLYCYFLGLAHAWLQKDAVAGWLLPSEFMDVNYGGPIKKYLIEKVTLLHIHRFDPDELQFNDALVSSAIVWFRNVSPPSNYPVEFSFGGSLHSPKLSRTISSATLRSEVKWTRFPNSTIRKNTTHYSLSDLFSIKRGVATGNNKYFILTKEQITQHELPLEVFRPILPSPRYLSSNEIQSDSNGLPLVSRQVFLLDCYLSEDKIREQYPKLWDYLEKGKAEVSDRYLCRSRKVWYFQERRSPAPILFTYIGRRDEKNGLSLRFILNFSNAIAANVYLLLYPKPLLSSALAADTTLLRRLWESLNNLCPSSLTEEGRVYGGGLYKLEPKELGNVDATSIIHNIPELQNINLLAVQQQLI